jgi:hypothetical protein
MFSLLLVYRGSQELGDVPIVQLDDDSLSRDFARRAIVRLDQKANVLRLIDGEAADDAMNQVDRLRAVLQTV